MPEDMLLSVDPLQFFVGAHRTPHTTVEKPGMEGSIETFKPLCVVTGSTRLPEIIWLFKKARCSDCNRGTHLQWCYCSAPHAEIQKHMLFRLCQSCAQRRGGLYKQALDQFLHAATQLRPLSAMRLTPQTITVEGWEDRLLPMPLSSGQE